MDLNLNDFSGIYNDESQFMDTSNANINNVFQNNPSPQREEVKKQQMIGLDDLNFNDNNLMNMSRISNHDHEIGVEQKHVDGIKGQDDRMPEMQQQIFEQPKQVQPVQPAVTEASANEWKKPVI